MTVVLACAAASQIMQNAEAARTRMTACGSGGRSGHRQRVDHAAGVGSCGWPNSVGIGESPAALGPLILPDAADDHARAGEAAGGERLRVVAIAVTAAGPADLREGNRVAGAVAECDGHGRGHVGCAGAGTGGAIEATDIKLRWDAAENEVIVEAVSLGAVGRHRLRSSVAHGSCGAGH